jgi:hypothetical protein
LFDRWHIGVTAHTQHSIVISIEFHYLTQTRCEQGTPVSLIDVPE